MRVYLAARYSRRAEMEGYAKDLRAIGVEVTSRWITGCHEIAGNTEALYARNAYTTDERRHFAVEGIEDIRYSTAMIAFTEVDGVHAHRGRGGRHVEFGVAVAKGLRLFVVGPRENVFHCLAAVNQFDTWDACLRAITHIRNTE